MADFFFLLFGAPGFAAGICLMAFVLWMAGVRDPFILAGLALFVGGPAGWYAEAKLADRLWKRGPRTKVSDPTRTHQP